MPDDWFRSQAWTPEAIAEFEVRLGRSRLHSRSQYLRIKALALIDAGLTDSAQGLLQRVLDDFPESLDAHHAQEVIGDLLRRRGDLAGAEAAYRRVLVMSPNLSGTTGEVRLSLGEVILESRGAGAVPEVRALLVEAEPDLRFNSTIFRALVLSAKAAHAAGDIDLQVAEANRALDLVGASPQLSRHPTVGLPTPSAAEVADLQNLAHP